MLLLVKQWLSQLDSRKEEGQGLIEYALIIVLVVIVVIVALRVLGPQIAGVYTDITGELGGL